MNLPSARFLTGDTRVQSDSKRPTLQRGELPLVGLPRVYSYDGAVDVLGSLPEFVGSGRVMVVGNDSTLQASGAGPILEKYLRSRPMVHVRDFPPNPQLTFLQETRCQIGDGPIDLVLAVGGGTAIDIAKVLRGSYQFDVAPEIMTQSVLWTPRRSIPMIAVPTTAGSGSEATQFAVVYSGGLKFSVSHPSLIPDTAIIDPLLSRSAPRRQAASSGLDALCQSIESLWALGASVESVRMAEAAFRALWENLEPTVNSPSEDLRAATCEAAHLAGRAINLSRTTACHALSYGLTARYGVPHGFAVAMFLPHLLAFNAEVDEAPTKRGEADTACRDRVQRILDVMKSPTVDEACVAFRTLMRRMDAPVRLRDVGIKKSDLSSLVDAVDSVRLSNNPRLVSRESVCEIFRRAF